MTEKIHKATIVQAGSTNLPEVMNLQSGSCLFRLSVLIGLELKEKKQQNMSRVYQVLALKPEHNGSRGSTFWTRGT